MALLDIICRDLNIAEQYELTYELGLAQLQERSFIRKDFVDMLKRIFVRDADTLTSLQRLTNLTLGDAEQDSPAASDLEEGEDDSLAESPEQPGPVGDDPGPERRSPGSRVFRRDPERSFGPSPLSGPTASRFFERGQPKQLNPEATDFEGHRRPITSFPYNSMGTGGAFALNTDMAQGQHSGEPDEFGPGKKGKERARD